MTTKTCSACGAKISMGEWLTLTLNGFMDTDDPTLTIELRTHSCGSTIAVPVKLLVAADGRAWFDAMKLEYTRAYGCVRRGTHQPRAQSLLDALRIVMNEFRLTRARSDREFADRFWSNVNKAGSNAHPGCWIWLASKTKGYGALGRRIDGRNVTLQAHRVAYELAVGAIPDGLVLDHLCRNPSCVNPAHLEPVTNAENLRRGVQGMRKYTPLVAGARRGRWLILAQDSSAKRTSWMCRCDCGRTRSVLDISLQSGASRSCGCVQHELARQICLVRNASKRRTPDSRLEE